MTVILVVLLYLLITLLVWYAFVRRAGHACPRCDRLMRRPGGPCPGCGWIARE